MLSALEGPGSASEQRKFSAESGLLTPVYVAIWG